MNVKFQVLLLIVSHTHFRSEFSLSHYRMWLTLWCKPFHSSSGFTLSLFLLEGWPQLQTQSICSLCLVFSQDYCLFISINLPLQLWPVFPSGWKINIHIALCFDYHAPSWECCIKVGCCILANSLHVVLISEEHFYLLVCLGPLYALWTIKSCKRAKFKRHYVR